MQVQGITSSHSYTIKIQLTAIGLVREHLDRNLIKLKISQRTLMKTKCRISFFRPVGVATILILLWKSIQGWFFTLRQVNYNEVHHFKELNGVEFVSYTLAWATLCEKNLAREKAVTWSTSSINSIIGIYILWLCFTITTTSPFVPSKFG